MSDEILKLLLGLGPAGVVAGIAIYLMVQEKNERRAEQAASRAELAEALASLRDELHDALATLPAWLQAIHSRLSGLGADSMPPPVAIAAPSRRRRRPPGERLPKLQTAPTGVPITRAALPPDEGDGP